MKNQEELAGWYFDKYIAHSLQESGTPEDGLIYLRETYIESAVRNHVAMKQIREILQRDYDGPTKVER